MIAILDSMNYFTNLDLSNFVNKNNVNVYMKRYNDKKRIYRIKQGIYVSKDRIAYFEKLNKKTEYIEYLASNVMYTPSYFSCEYIL